ncbi:nitroreductase family protein [Desulfotomaculum defluvii]
MLELLKQRRSIRKFKTQEIEPEKIAQLIQGALLSPSSRSFTPWEFIIVTDKQLLQQLASAKQAGSAFLKNAPLAIVVLADPQVSDVWIEDASIASILIQLVAVSMGLGSCWVQIRERKHNDSVTSEDYVREVLNIPEQIKVEAIIAIGYPNESKSYHREEELKYQKVFLNGYQVPYTFSK